MRNLAACIVIVVALAACANSSGSGGAPAPAPSPADLHPCAVGGACTVNVVLPDDVARLLDQSGIVFKVYDGCPRTLGFRDITVGTSPMLTDNVLSIKTNSSMRSAVPVVQLSNPLIVVPRLSGRYATVGIFFRTEPGKYVVVDFGTDPDQAARFGYLYNGHTIIDDNLVDSQNRMTERHLCP